MTVTFNNPTKDIDVQMKECFILGLLISQNLNTNESTIYLSSKDMT